MKWSWKIGDFAGIGVYMHATFLLLIAWVAWAHWSVGEDLYAILGGIGFVLALFLCVVLHEFGHALTARRYGIQTRDITLLPIGGVARLERMPDEPRQELLVALAGPAVNVVIAAGLFVWIALVDRFQPLDEMEVAEGSIAQRLLVANIFLVVFNLLPAFPMDGGRVLRALLAMRMDYGKATNLAARTGQFMAFVFGLIGLFSQNPFLLFIAFFVYIGAVQEAGMVQMKTALGGIPVQNAMLTRFDTISPHDSLQRAVDLTIAGSQRDFPVVDHGRLVGLLHQEDLIRAIQEASSQNQVGSVMKTDFAACHPGDMLESVLARLQEEGAHTVPVTRDGQLLGLLTMDNVGEMLRINAAARNGQGLSPNSVI